MRLRPDETPARQNLELVLRRALQLADQLADRNAEEIEKQLDGLIAALRSFIGAVANTVEDQARREAVIPPFYRNDRAVFCPHSTK